jgi:hypothetical protein
MSREQNREQNPCKLQLFIVKACGDYETMQCINENQIEFQVSAKHELLFTMPGYGVSKVPLPARILGWIQKVTESKTRSTKGHDSVATLSVTQLDATPAVSSSVTAASPATIVTASPPSSDQLDGKQLDTNGSSDEFDENISDMGQTEPGQSSVSPFADLDVDTVQSATTTSALADAPIGAVAQGPSVSAAPVSDVVDSAPTPISVSIDPTPVSAAAPSLSHNTEMVQMARKKNKKNKSWHHARKMGTTPMHPIGPASAVATPAPSTGYTYGSGGYYYPSGPAAYTSYTPTMVPGNTAATAYYPVSWSQYGNVPFGPMIMPYPTIPAKPASTPALTTDPKSTLRLWFYQALGPLTLSVDSKYQGRTDTLSIRDNGPIVTSDGTVVPWNLITTACAARTKCLQPNCYRVHGDWSASQSNESTLSTHKVGSTVCLAKLVGHCLNGAKCKFRHFSSIWPLTSIQRYAFSMDPTFDSHPLAPQASQSVGLLAYGVPYVSNTDSPTPTPPISAPAVKTWAKVASNALNGHAKTFTPKALPKAIPTASAAPSTPRVSGADSKQTHIILQPTPAPTPLPQPIKGGSASSRAASVPSNTRLPSVEGDTNYMDAQEEEEDGDGGWKGEPSFH